MIITIARQAGSRGQDVAFHVAHRLGEPMIGREQIDRSAASVGVGRQPLDETRMPMIARRIVDVLFGGQDPRVGLAAPAGSFPTTRNPEYRTLVEQVLRDLAQRGPAVIVGNGAQYVLRGRSDALHVFITAPLAQRVRWVAMREDLEMGTAEHVVRESDRERAEYIRQVYGQRWDDPMVYDLILNMGQLSIDQAAEGVLAAAGRG